MKTNQISSIAKTTDINYVVSESTSALSFNQILKKISGFFSSLSNRGVKEGLTPNEIKRIRLTNLVSLLGVIVCGIELPIYISLGLTLPSILLFITWLCMAAVLVLSGYGLYNRSKILLLSITNFTLFYTASYLGKESGLYLYYFTLIFLPCILFDLKEKAKIVTFTLITILAVYLLEYSNLEFLKGEAIPDSMKKIIFVSTLPSCFLTITFCVYSLVKENSVSEKRMLESETLFKGLFDATPDSTIITDDKGYITLCNMQLTKIFGYHTEELLGKHISILIPPHLRQEHAKHFGMLPAEAKKNAKNSAVDLLVSKKDGKEIPVELSLNSYMAQEGKMIIVVIRDITERKKHEQELIQFSYVVSHDLKAPLRAIFKLSEWIHEELGTRVSATVQKNLELLRGRVFRLEGLINGLLEYAKIGRTNVKNEKVNTRALINEVTDILAPPPHINIQIQENMPVFETPKVPLQQVFFNLLSNAIKFNDKKEGLITISFDSNEKFYSFSVSDNGIGIEPIYHEKIFVIFQTLEARDKVEGTGIGLTIVKKSVEDMGGKITLHSEPGKGSKFTFTWPKHRA